MTNNEIHKQEFRIRDLTTRSVLLFPTRAQIIRDIKEITLHPGANQIVIDGLAPTVDEHSIKVEGTGSATITDVSVNLLPNREAYEDIYPSEDDDEDEDEEDESEVEQETMKDLAKKIKELNVKLLGEQESINSAARRLEICDSFGLSGAKERPPPADLEKLIKAYNEERAKIYHDHKKSTLACEGIREDILKAEKEQTKRAKELLKANEKKEKEKAKMREKKARKKAEISKEKQRVKAERESFWPKKVYKITINLEPSSLTPGSSRRSSIDDGDTVVNLATSTFHEAPQTPLKSGEINLSLSYITYSASWSPRYDLSLSTTKSAGLLEYGAELKNTTSETWRDAKVVLSTSQTSFSGLSETIPILQPWHVRLLKGGGNRGSEAALMSQHEVAAKKSVLAVDQSQKPRGELFGRDYFPHRAYAQRAPPPPAPPASKRARDASAPVAPSAFGSSSVFGGSFQSQATGIQTAPQGFGATQTTSASGGLFGNRAASRAPAPMQSGHMQTAAVSEEAPGAMDVLQDSDFDSFASTGDTAAAPNSLEFEAGAWEESGMTTTYDVPGSKTLAPSHSTIKHKIAKIDFRNVIFSHIVIGKLRQVAFLKARLRNSSKIALLKGPLGLTLDSSFLGQATFPRCSAGETFTLPLGVDPALNIAYPKPTVRRSQTGIFNREDSNVFSRSVIITNTKHNAAVDLTVLDQVPVSEDQRLKIDITNPPGLRAGGDPVRTGSSAVAALPGGKGNAKDVRASVYDADGKEVVKQGTWGSAVATAKKGGEVSWNVRLNPGQGVKLVLEYQATFPADENVVGMF